MINNDGMCVLNRTVYFVSRDEGYLYSCDLDTFEIELLSSHQGIITGMRKYRKVLYQDEIIICLPDTANDIMIYNTKTLQESYIPMPEQIRYAFLNAWVINNAVWCISCITNDLYKIDIRDKKVVKKVIFGSDEKGNCFKCDMYKETIYIGLFQLAPEAGDMHAQGIVINKNRIIPQIFDQFCPGNNLSVFPEKAA